MKAHYDLRENICKPCCRQAPYSQFLTALFRQPEIVLYLLI